MTHFKRLMLGLLAMLMLQTTAWSAQNAVTIPTTGPLPGLTLLNDLNAAMATLETVNSGTTAPTAAGLGLSSLAGVVWHDTTTNTLKIRDQADSAWIVLFNLDETSKQAAGNSPVLASGSTQGISGTNHYSMFVATASATYTVAQTTGFYNGFGFDVFAQGGAITISINGTDKINGGSAGVGITIPVGFAADFVTDGAGNWWVNSSPAVLGTGSIASASTTDLGSVAAPAITVTGSTTITSFGSSAQAGQIKIVTFAGALVLTNNGTGLILPNNGNNMLTAAGDSAVVLALGSGNWKVISYQTANGLPYMAGAANGLATLGSGGTIPVTQLGTGSGVSNTFLNNTGAFSVPVINGYDPIANINTAITGIRGLGLTSSAGHIYNGQIDAFNDQTGTDGYNSVGQTYDATNKWYTNYYYSVDPYTKALFHFDGNATDSSSTGVVFTNVGTVTFPSGTVKFGTGAAYLSANTQYLSYTGGQLGLSGDFTVEMNVYFTGSGVSYTSGVLMSTRSGNTSSGFLVQTTSSTTLNIQTAGTSYITFNTPTAGAWHHLAIVRYSGTLKVYVDGTYTGTSASVSTNFSDGYFHLNYDPNAGASGGANVGWSADEVRISQYARYTANFTPPTAAFTLSSPSQSFADSATDINTGALFHFDNNVTDSSSNAITATLSNGSYGTAKFGTYGLSFNGTSTKLSSTSNLATVWLGDMTADGWVNPTNFSASRPVFDTRANTGSTGGVLLSINTSGYPTVNINGSTAITSSIALTAGVYTHVALVRSNGVFTLYVGGQPAGTYSNSNQLIDGKFLMGNDVGGGSWFYGLMDEWRFSNTARWSGAFTPPTAATSLGTGFSLQTQALTAMNGTPSIGHIVLRHLDVNGTVALNTDLLADISSNGGTTWNTVTLSKNEPWSSTANDNIISGAVTLTGGSTAMLCRVRTANSKPQRIRAEGCYWN